MNESKKVSGIVQRIGDLSKTMSPEDRDAMFHSFEVALAHMLKADPKQRKANPQEWKETKHLCKEFDVIGYRVKIARQEKALKLAA